MNFNTNPRKVYWVNHNQDVNVWCRRRELSTPETPLTIVVITTNRYPHLSMLRGLTLSREITHPDGESSDLFRANNFFGFVNVARSSEEYIDREMEN